MTTLVKPEKSEGKRRAKRARAVTHEPARARFNPVPPITPPRCLTDRAPDATLNDEEYIEALEWLQACIRSIVITDKGAQ